MDLFYDASSLIANQSGEIRHEGREARKPAGFVICRGKKTRKN
jgi:hypothetical protein